jgi:hypothetical protein
MSLITKTLSIPTYRVPAVQAVVADLGRRAAKCGTTAPVMTVAGERLVDVSEDAKHPQYVAYSAVSFTYEMIVLAGGWRFLASIETVDRVDGVARNRVSGPNLDDSIAVQYCTAEQRCEHCNHTRARKQTYLLRDAAGATKQIGSTCLEAYLGVDPSSAIDSMLIGTLISEISEDDERFGRGGAPRAWDLDTAAAQIVAILAIDGFARSGGDGDSTGIIVCTALSHGPRLREWAAERAPTEQHVIIAKSVVERLTARILVPYRDAPLTLDGFSFKIGVLLNRGFVEARDMQILAAAIHREAVELAQPKGEARPEGFLPGAVEGGKVEVTVSVESVRFIPSDFGGSLLIKMITDAGYSLSSFYSGKSSEFVPGAKLAIKGTVKHLEDSPKFGKSVMISRIKVSR